MAKHLIRVEATRRIKQPLYGPHAFSRDTKTIEIPFGKNETIKTGASAMAKAQELANSLLKDASSVSIWRICGGSGTGEYLKDDETKFETGWN